jgi:hypothetical protein
LKESEYALNEGGYVILNEKGIPDRYEISNGQKVLFQIKLKAPFPQLIYVLAIEDYAPIPHELIDYYLASRDDGKGGRETIPLKERSPEINDFHAAVGTGAYYLSEFVDGADLKALLAALGNLGLTRRGYGTAREVLLNRVKPAELSATDFGRTIEGI